MNLGYLLLFVAASLSASFAIWGTFTSHREDFSINDVKMYTKMGHFKDGSEKANPDGDAIDMGEDAITSLYDVRFRPPYADIVRYSTLGVGVDAEKPKDEDWAKYHKRYRQMPTSVISYDMTKTSAERTKAECLDICHGSYAQDDGHAAQKTADEAADPDTKKGNSHCNDDDMSLTEQACYVLIPGCAQFASVANGNHLTDTQYASLEIDEDCTKKFKHVAKTGENADNTFVWVIALLWALMAFGTIMMLAMPDDSKQQWPLIILLILALALCAMMTTYALMTNQTIDIKKPTKDGQSEFVVGKCYGSYYANAFGYVQAKDDGNMIQEEKSPFTWDTDFRGESTDAAG